MPPFLVCLPRYLKNLQGSRYPAGSDVTFQLLLSELYIGRFLLSASTRPAQQDSYNTVRKETTWILNPAGPSKVSHLVKECITCIMVTKKNLYILGKTLTPNKPTSVRTQINKS